MDARARYAYLGRVLTGPALRTRALALLTAELCRVEGSLATVPDRAGLPSRAALARILRILERPGRAPRYLFLRFRSQRHRPRRRRPGKRERLATVQLFATRRSLRAALVASTARWGGEDDVVHVVFDLREGTARGTWAIGPADDLLAMHPTVWCPDVGAGVWLDRGVAPLVRAAGARGCPTCLSCQGGPAATGEGEAPAYLAFADPAALERLWSLIPEALRTGCMRQDRWIIDPEDPALAIGRLTLSPARVLELTHALEMLDHPDPPT